MSEPALCAKPQPRSVRDRQVAPCHFSAVSSHLLATTGPARLEGLSVPLPSGVRKQDGFQMESNPRPFGSPGNYQSHTDSKQGAPTSSCAQRETVLF